MVRHLRMRVLSRVSFYARHGFLWHFEQHSRTVHLCSSEQRYLRMLFATRATPQLHVNCEVEGRANVSVSG